MKISLTVVHDYLYERDQVKIQMMDGATMKGYIESLIDDRYLVFAWRRCMFFFMPVIIPMEYIDSIEQS
ncbi:hypothetical protein D4L85_16375 [Chryseolinea soli]|uniref:DUF2642 domain-containing protein n=1 Tax=Chryseolinea soli TaxID=2321403 RepID=A0A385SP41_9BACT|nr:hypothetical protein D4L85_16375 [Chryseolinea soli]